MSLKMAYKTHMEILVDICVDLLRGPRTSRTLRTKVRMEWVRVSKL